MEELINQLIKVKNFCVENQIYETVDLINELIETITVPAAERAVQQEDFIPDDNEKIIVNIQNINIYPKADASAEQSPPSIVKKIF